MKILEFHVRGRVVLLEGKLKSSPLPIYFSWLVGWSNSLCAYPGRTLERPIKLTIIIRMHNWRQLWYSGILDLLLSVCLQWRIQTPPA